MTPTIPDNYFTIEQNNTAEFKDRGSRFIAYLFPIDNINAFKKHLADVKKEQAKATHHCFAYRLGVDGNSFRVSDDGEPSGSAGRPILGQIDSKKATNTLIIVVRYFGGTQLGIPGLINAYKTAASMSLQITPLVSKPVLINYRLQFDYTQMNELIRLIKQFDCVVLKQELQLFCFIEIGIPKNKEENVLCRLNEMQTIEIIKL